MNVMVFIGPTVSSFVALGIAATFFNQASLPNLFPWSGVFLPMLATFVLALGIGMLLPDRLYFTRSERLKRDLYLATGLSETASARILDNVQKAQSLADRLRQASTGLRSDLSEQTLAAAVDLDTLAKQMLSEPGKASATVNLVSRASLVVDAVEDFIAYKAQPGAETEAIDTARDRIADSIAAMSDAAEAVQVRLARQKLVDLEVATEVADGLLNRSKLE